MRKLTKMFQGPWLASLPYRKPMRIRAALSGETQRGFVSWGEGQLEVSRVWLTVCRAGLVYCRCFSVWLLGECCNFSTLYR